MPKKCGCYCKNHDDSRGAYRTQHIARANAQGWFTTGQASKTLGINVNSLNLLLDSGAVQGVRRTKGGHRWVPQSAIDQIAAMDPEQYQLLAGIRVGSRLPRGFGKAA